MTQRSVRRRAWLIAVGLGASGQPATAGAGTALGHMVDVAAGAVAGLLGKQTDPLPPPAHPRKPSGGTADGPRMDPPLDSSPHGVFKRLELEAERETRQREARATKDRGALMDTISIAFRRPPTVLFAKASAQRFGKEFRIGASEATHQLEKLKRTRPDLAKPWLNTPKGRRVFIIGSSADNPDVVRLRDSLRAKAFECFFYKFCESETTPLCSSQEVGAFFGTAGHIVTVTSRAAKASDYIPVEIGSAKKHLQGGMIIVITPESLLKLSAASGTAVAANVVFLDDRRQPRRQG